MNEDESALSEITILPDGRVYAFGITCQIADLLRQLTSRTVAEVEPAETIAVQPHQEPE